MALTVAVPMSGLVDGDVFGFRGEALSTDAAAESRGRMAELGAATRQVSVYGLEARDDDALMVLARDGMGTAFDELVRRYQAPVLRAALRYLGGEDAAADMAQNAFLAIYRALPTYQPRGKFRAYLYRVLLTQCRMAQRSGRYDKRARAAIKLTAPVASTPGTGRLFSPEQRREVELALAKLSPKLRDVIVLRFAADLPLDDIAEALQIPLGTVKRRLFDGLAILKKRAISDGR